MPLSSTATGVADSPTFEQLWEEAVQRHNLNSKPIDPELAKCNTIDEVIRVLEKKESAHKVFREKGKNVLDVLVRVASFVGRFLDAGAEAAAASGHVPGGKAILVAFGALLAATKGVSEVYDALEELFTKLQSYLKRLDTYFASPSVVSPEFRAIMVKILVQFLNVLALCTRRMRDGVHRFRKFLRKRTEDYFRVLFGDTEVQDALKKLDKLTGEEHQRSMAEVLVASKTAARDVEEMRKEFFTAGITKWLSPPDHEESHNRVSKCRQEGDGNWLSSSNEYKEWMETRNGVLWVSGTPGSGKSVQFSSTVDELSAGPVTIYFYFDYRDSAKQTIRGFLTSALYQLASRSSDCSGLLNKFYEEHRASLSPPNDDKLFDRLEDMLRALPQVNMLLDALDECSKDERRTGLFPVLKKIVALNLNGLRLLVTSRLETDIQKCMVAITASQVEMHGAPKHLEGLERHIRSRLASVEDYPDWSEDLRTQAGDILSNKSNGMFLWANLQLDRLRECPLSDVKRRLHSLPATLHDTYRRILEDINADDALLAHRVFECIAFAARPLSPQELVEVLALNFESGDAVLEPAYRSAEPEPLLLKICSSIVQIITDDSNGGEIRRVQFVHFSAKEYLLSARLSKHIAVYSINAVSAHTILARLCFSLVNSSTDLSSQPFSSYAVQNWMCHVQLDIVQVIMNENLAKLLHPDSVFFSRWLKKFIDSADLSSTFDCPYDKYSTPLFVAAHVGLSEQVRVLVDVFDVEINDPQSSALWAAIVANNTEITRLLLQRGANVNNPNFHPLNAALFQRHVHLALMLFEYGADVNTCDGDRGWAPLHVAVLSRLVEVVRLLSDRGADMNARTRDGLSPLHIATFNSDLGLIEFLLDQSATVDARTNDRLTPLHLATTANRLDTVQLLLERGADVDARQDGELTPLHMAARGGYVDTARLLLGRGANVDARGEEQQIPLHLAALEGHTDVARLLLERGADVDARNCEEWTPLHLAARVGHVDVASLLLERGANVDARVKAQHAPLHLAAQDGHTNVARLLLERGADVDARDCKEWTPLHLAAFQGHVTLARLLLERGADVNARSDNQSTPLHIAAGNGHLDIARLLVKRNADVDAREENQCTPLQLAAIDGHVDVARLLLEQGADVNARSDNQSTPLHIAAGNGHLDIARLLVKRNADVDARTEHQCTPLQWAAQGGHINIARLLLEHGADVNARADDQSTALHAAAESGHLDIARELLKRGASVGAVTVEGMSPMRLAAGYKHTEVVRLLVEWIRSETVQKW